MGRHERAATAKAATELPRTESPTQLETTARMIHVSGGTPYPVRETTAIPIGSEHGPNRFTDLKMAKTPVRGRFADPKMAKTAVCGRFTHPEMPKTPVRSRLADLAMPKTAVRSRFTDLAMPKPPVRSRFGDLGIG